jgi:hypothetical protein
LDTGGQSTTARAPALRANLYGYDGTGIWITIRTSSERVDLRARRWAYLSLFAPVAQVVAVGAPVVPPVVNGRFIVRAAPHLREATRLTEALLRQALAPELDHKSGYFADCPSGAADRK